MIDYKYAKYVPPFQETRWATLDELRNDGSHVDLSQDTYPAAGLPLLSDGREAWVDNSDTHSLIFGATGSKKTRLFCMPMLNMFIKAGESFIATDPKGELYERSSGLAKANGYKTVVLNFRDVGNGDMWNPLYLPYRLYHEGNVEAAVTLLNDFVSSISARQFETSNDAFWPEMASSYAIACLLLLMECATEQEANAASLGALCNERAVPILTKLSAHMRDDTIAGINFKAVLSSAEKTRASILVSLYGMVRIFNTQKQLTNMLSGNTVNVKDFGKEKTAVYLIVPDEKTTLHFLVTTFIKQAYEILISEAQHAPGRVLPVRVNFVLDEFCNIPTISDMPSMISAARSRNMRFYLVVQSLHQLKSRYGEDADTIKANCDNWVFLTSKELALLNEISELCGNVFTSEREQRRLISVSQLQRLNKQKGETLIMHARQYPIIVEIADIDMYEAFKGYPAAPMRSFEIPEAKVFSLEKLMDRILEEDVPIPFS